MSEYPSLLKTSQSGSAKVQPNIESSISDLDPVLGRLEEMVTQAGLISDRVHGPSPRDPGSDKVNAPTPMGLLNALSVRCTRLVQLLDRLQAELNSIGNGLS